MGEAIESILAQDFTDFELLLADNGSTDATSEICAGYASRDGRVRVHRSPKNRGAAWNFNRCVDLARGRYFKWAAHDDVLESSYLTRCVEAIEERPDVVLCYPRAIDIDENGTPIAEHEPLRYATEYRPSERARSALSRETPCLESFGVMRRATLLQTSRLGGYTGSDRVLFVELALLGRFHEVPDVLFRHRQHASRSVHRYADDRQRNAWFDPARAGRYTSPKWRLLRGYAHAIFTARTPLIERVCSTTGLIRWIWAHHGTLGREAFTAALHLLRLRHLSYVFDAAARIDPEDGGGPPPGGGGNETTTTDATFTTRAVDTTGPVIDVWYGDTPVFGQNGQPQTWANVLGTVSDRDGVSSLTYSLNGGPTEPLRMGTDLRRLASPGGFNVEIAYASLAEGDNTVTITAVNALGGTSTRTVTVTRVMGVAPLPYDTAWAGRGSITEAAQVVDGPWSLVPGGGVRADVLAYDRLLAIGDIGWTDYEVTVPVTAFALGPNAGTLQSGAPLIGIGLHWQGHTQTRSEQPRTRFWPTGAFAWHRWQGSGCFELQGNLGSPLVRNGRTMQCGTTYVMKARAETVTGGVAYFYKVWPAAEAEPAAWDLQIVENSGPPSGSVLLIAHHVNAVFGDVVVTPLP